jgi:hypothetical protein
MILAHAFAPLSLMPFLVVETVRFARHRKTDYVLWAAMLLPMIGMITYIPLFHSRVTSALYPQAFQASFKKMFSVFYHTTNTAMSAAVALALMGALLARREKVTGAELPPIKVEEALLFSILLMNPVLLNLAFMPSHVAFWDRYCITTSAVIYIAAALIVSRRLQANKLAGSTACLILVLFLGVHAMLLPLRQKTPPNAAVLEHLRPDLPLVTASRLAFLEMNHIEGPQILSRLCYLSDRQAAVQYAHATVSEEIDPPAKLKHAFGLKGNTEPYRDFTRQHRRFLVLGTYNFPEDWLLRKLHADGAKLTIIGHYAWPYRDKDLYLVTR